MQWVETTGRTLEEAKELALDQLGVSEDDAEFDVLEEPRPGLFGRVRGEARVRARVRPTTPRAKTERRDRRKGKPAGSARPAGQGDDTASDDDAAPTAAVAVDDTTDDDTAAETPERARSGSGARGPKSNGNRRGGRGGQGGRTGGPAGPPKDRPARPATGEEGGAEVSAEEVGKEAVAFLDELVKAFGLEGTSQLERDGDELEVKVEGPELGLLIGPRGQTLLAVQELTRVVAQRRLGDHETRLRIDIGGYRERRRAALTRFTIEQADAVKTSGQARRLEPMPSADRKVIHDTIATIEGVSSKSEGDDPFRRVVIVPAGESAD